MKYSKDIYFLDIGNRSLKLLTARKQGKSWQVTDAQVAHLPVDSANAGPASQSQKWLTVLDRLLSQETDKDKKKIYVSLPSSQSFLRYISLPNIPLSKIRKIIPFEAEQQIPFELEKVDWGYAVLPSIKTNEVDVVIAAAKKTFTEILKTYLEERDFEIAAFELPQMILHNMRKQMYPDVKDSIIIDVGMNGTEVILSYRGTVWGRSLRRGAGEIIKAFSSEFGLSAEESEKRVRQSMESLSLIEESEAKEHVILRNFYDDLCSDISRTCSYYASMARGASFGRVFLTGGGSFTKGLSEYLADFLDAEVSFLDATDKVNPVAHVKERLLLSGRIYHLVSGMLLAADSEKALRPEILDKTQKNKAETSGKKVRKRIILGVIFVLLITGFVNTRVKLGMTQRLLHRSEEVLAEIRDKESPLKVLERHIQEKESLLNLLKDRKERAVFMKRALYDIASAVTLNMWLTDMKYDSVEENITVSGKTPETLSSIQDFAGKLEGLDYVDSVSFDAANISEDIGGGRIPLRSFLIHIRLKEQKAEK